MRGESISPDTKTESKSMWRFLIVMIFLGTPTWADFVDGNDLYDICIDDGHDFHEGFCMAYVLGVADTLEGGKNAIGGYKVCFPIGITIQQTIDVTANWLEANPGKRHYSASSLVALALSEVFPCR